MAAADASPFDTRERAADAIASGQAMQPRRIGVLYSHFVAFLKLTLPMIAVALLLVVLLWSQLTSKDDGFTIGVADITVEDAKNLIMTNPRYLGVDKENRPYTLTAKDAKQASGDDQMVGLTGPKADITMKDGTWIALTAEQGNYYRDVRVLDLFGSVNLYHDEGYEFHTTSAQFDFVAGSALGEEPIQGQGPLGTIEAQGFRIHNRGETLVFTGKSHMVIFPDANSPGG